MTYVTATADKVPSGHGISISGTVALVMVALASGAAAWTAYPVTWISDSASSEDINTSSFDDRFAADSGQFASDVLPVTRCSIIAFRTRDQISTSERPARAETAVSRAAGSPCGGTHAVKRRCRSRSQASSR